MQTAIPPKWRASVSPVVYAVFILDAVPGKEEDVLRALDKVEAVVAKRLLEEKVANADLIAMVRAPDMDKAQRIATGELRGISGVFSVREVGPEQTIAPRLLKIVREMHAEATGKQA